MQPEFIRQQMLLGENAMQRLQNCHVIVFGIGGVGSYCVEALARAGVGQLTLVDNDTVSLSNLNRQLCALHSTVGQGKAQVMADRVKDISSECRVRVLCEKYCADSKELFFDTPYDYIADCIDTVSCKLSLIEEAKQRNLPILSAMGTGNKLDPTQFCITDISKTSGCHLARVMRRELRSRGILHHTVLYSEEVPQTPEELEAPPPGRRSIPGSVSWVPSVAGLMMAGYIVRQLIETE